MDINSRFNIGDVCYLKTDPDQLERFVTAIKINSNGLTYEVSYIADYSYHYDFEISKERNNLKAIQ